MAIHVELSIDPDKGSLKSVGYSHGSNMNIGFNVKIKPQLDLSEHDFTRLPLIMSIVPGVVQEYDTFHESVTRRQDKHFERFEAWRQGLAVIQGHTLLNKYEIAGIPEALLSGPLYETGVSFGSADSTITLPRRPSSPVILVGYLEATVYVIVQHVSSFSYFTLTVRHDFSLHIPSYNRGVYTDLKASSKLVRHNASLFVTSPSRDDWVMDNYVSSLREYSPIAYSLFRYVNGIAPSKVEAVKALNEINVAANVRQRVLYPLGHGSIWHQRWIGTLHTVMQNLSP